MKQRSESQGGPPPGNDDSEAAARRTPLLLLKGLFGVLFGNRQAYREFRREFTATFPEPTEEEQRAAEEATPQHLRWWAAEARDPTDAEASMSCKHCGKPIADQTVRQCPNCALLLHATCYGDTMGGNAYQTPDCEACRARCYWR